jgi:hypothetical protein
MPGFKTNKDQNLQKDFGNGVNFNMAQLFFLQCFKLSTGLLGIVFTNSKNPDKRHLLTVWTNCDAPWLMSYKFCLVMELCLPP